ncbi:MAG: dihydrodipicolinate synthase family protein [Pseudomonadota bacterium]
MKIEGIYTPVITPFTADGAVDQDGYAVMLEHLIENGIHGIVVGGTTGEFYALSKEERLAQFRHAQEVIGGRVPWLAGVNDFRTEEAVAFAQAAKEIGADGLLLAAPPYSQPSQSDLAHHALTVDRAVGLPIMLYNYPGRTGVMMEEAFLRAVSESENFCAIKESSGEIDRLHLLAQDFPNLQLSCGADDQALEFFVWGATSWVCALGNFIPREIVLLYQTCAVDGDYAMGRRLMSALLPLASLLERGGAFMQCVKHACALDGLPTGEVRPPLQPMSDELKAQTAAMLEQVKAGFRRALGPEPVRLAGGDQA